MRFFRSQRVESLIQAQLSRILIREVEFPEGSLVTIVSVDVDKKLDRAKVGLSVIPSSAAKSALYTVTTRVGELQFLLAKTINIKPMPRLIFQIDRGPENAAEVEKRLLEEDEK
jgi:ribosome-binding factor A